tara:strand:- start:8015 stop:8233 length:219 start_codon:yes stop_codon:yes gene_type:complete
MKQLIYPIELKVVFNEDSPEPVLAISVHYGREAEGVGDNRGLEVTLSSQRISDLQDIIITEVMPQINIEEGL